MIHPSDSRGHTSESGEVSPFPESRTGRPVPQGSAVIIDVDSHPSLDESLPRNRHGGNELSAASV